MLSSFPLFKRCQIHHSLQDAASGTSTCTVHPCAGGYVVVNVLADLPPCEVDVKFASSHGFRFPQTSDANRVSVKYIAV